MCPGHLLSHSSEEALRVEETRHPEDIGAGSEDPLGELTIALYKFCEPEAQCRGFPGHLQNDRCLLFNTIQSYKWCTVRANSAWVCTHSYVPFSTFLVPWHHTYSPKHLANSKRNKEQVNTCSTTWYIESSVCHSAHTSLMMMVPSMASCRSCRVVLTMVMTRCIRSISWRRKMFMEDSAPIFCSRAFTYGICMVVGGEDQNDVARVVWSIRKSYIWAPIL